MKAPRPPLANVNFLLLLVLLPAYSKVPVKSPVLPRITALALLPSTPLLLALLSVATFRVPSSTVNWPPNVLAPASISVAGPAKVMAADPAPAMTDEIPASAWVVMTPALPKVSVLPVSKNPA